MGRDRRRKRAGGSERAALARDAISTFEYARYARSGAARAYPGAQLGNVGRAVLHPAEVALAVDEREAQELGAVVDMDTWIQRTAQGRGAAVCVGTQLADLSELQMDGAQPAFRCHMVAAPEGQSERVLPAFFRGNQMLALHTLLGAPLQRSMPVSVFLSGYGGELIPLPDSDARTERGDGRNVSGVRAAVEFAQGRVSLKCLVPSVAGPAELIWFDCDRDGPLKLVRQTVSQRQAGELADDLTPPRAASPSSDSWLWTPEPTEPPTPAPMRAVRGTSRTPAPAAPAPAALADTSAGAPSGATRSQSTLSPPAPTYTPICALRRGSVANVVGVAVGNAEVRPPGGRSRDYMVKLTLQDSGDVNDTLSCNLFAGAQDQLPDSLAHHEVLMIRGLQIGEFNGHLQGVVNRRVRFEWAVWSPSVRTWRYAPGMSAASFSDAERGAAERLGDSVRAQSAGTPAAAPPATARSLTTLGELKINSFVDTVVEIRKVYPRSSPPDVYVTDYTTHPLFYRRNDRFLPHPPMGVEMDQGGGGAVLLVGVWDKQAPVAMQLHEGDLVLLENVRIKVFGRTGFLTGAVGTPYDRGLKVIPVDASHPAAAALLQRKRTFGEAPAALPPGSLKREADEPAPGLDGGPDPSEGAAARPSPPRKRVAPDAIRAPRFALEEEAEPASSAGGMLVNEPALPADTHIVTRLTTDARLPYVRLPPPAEFDPAMLPPSFYTTAVVCGVAPTQVLDWLRRYCRTCARVLPETDQFCSQCADEEGDQLEETIHFTLYVSDPHNVPRVPRRTQGIPLAVSHRAAQTFLGASPMDLYLPDVHERVQKAVDRLTNASPTYAITGMVQLGSATDTRADSAPCALLETRCLLDELVE